MTVRTFQPQSLAMLKQQFRRKVGRLCRTWRLVAGWNKPAGTALMYHSVGPTIQAGSLPAQKFEEQLAYLSKHRTVISLKEMVQCRRAGRPLPANCAAITFDDGFEDNYTQALPILLRNGLSATIFVTTAFVDGSIDITAMWPAYRGLRPLNWSQVLEMRAAGMDIGAHTATHPTLAGLSQPAAWKEIYDSKRYLEDRLQEPITLFAYPLGQPRTMPGILKRLVQQAGFSAACSTIWGADNRNTDLFALRRLRVDVFDTPEDFEAKLRGDWDFVALYQWLKSIAQTT